MMGQLGVYTDWEIAWFGATLDDCPRCGSPLAMEAGLQAVSWSQDGTPLVLCDACADDMNPDRFAGLVERRGEG